MNQRIAQLKTMLPRIPEIISSLKKESETSLSGPCPVCGGIDRFVYKVDTKRFWCRQCHEKSGDVVDFHKWFYGKTTGDLFKRYLPEDDQYHQKKPDKKELSPARLWDSLQKNTNTDPVFRLFSDRRKISKDVISQAFEQGKIRFLNHDEKATVGCAFSELNGDKKVLAVQYLSADETAFSYAEENKVFQSGSKAGNDCFFQAGTDIEKAEIIILCEAVVNALSCASCIPEACVLALGGSTMTKKVKALRSYRDNGKKIICFFDNDSAGRKANQAVAKTLGVKTNSIEWIGNTPDGYDVNDLLKKGEHKTIVGMLNSALPVKIEKKSISKDKSKPTIADSLVLLAKEKVKFFFCDQMDVPFACFPVKNHFEHWPIKSKNFKLWVQNRYYKMEGKGVNSEAIKEACDTLEAIAIFDGRGKIELHVRVCEYEGAYWYDLSNELWQAIKITENGWQIVDNPPILFRRLAHQKPQVLPSRKGNITALRPFLEGIEKPENRKLVTTCIISCLLPGFSHVVLIPHGDQGSGKTTFSKNSKRILDPSKIDTLGLIGEQRELVQTLSHHWMLSYDNLTNLSKEVQNILCRAVTGASYSKRKLYSDDEDIITSNRNCLIISGINIPGTQPDFLDRSILVRLKRFSNGQNKKDIILDEEFETALPFILGGMFDTISKAIQAKSRINLSTLPRMADFAEWGYCIAESMGFGGRNFLATYQKNITLRNQEIITSNPISNALMKFMENQDEWKGTAQELFDELDQIVPERERKQKIWPKTVNVFGRRLNVLKVNLNEAGLQIETEKTRSGRVISIVRNEGEKQDNFGINEI